MFLNFFEPRLGRFHSFRRSLHSCSTSFELSALRSYVLLQCFESGLFFFAQFFPYLEIFLLLLTLILQSFYSLLELLFLRLQRLFR